MTLLKQWLGTFLFYMKRTRPNRNNNPGDIEDGVFARKHGAIGSDDRFAKFATATAGFAAMAALLQIHYQGLTIRAALNKYAPPVENATDIYLQHVCEWAGVHPDDLIDTHLIAKVELRAA